jgi:O-methyltransferase
MEINNELLNRILSFENKRVDGSIISFEEISLMVEYLIETIDSNIEGDVVEFGCYVGENSKYTMKTLMETNSSKQLYLYDSFEGLPEQSEWEKGTGWRPGSLKTTEEVLFNNFKQNGLKIPIVHKDWFKDVPEYKIPDKISFAFLDGDFYDSIYDSLEKVYDKVSEGGYIFFHDYNRHDLPGVAAAIEDFMKKRNLYFEVTQIVNNLGVMKKTNNPENFDSLKKVTKKKVTTLVTGLWDLKREELTEGWSRSYENHYLKKFEELLKIDENMIIFGDADLEKFVSERRNPKNTKFVRRDLTWFIHNDYYQRIQKIRNNTEWFSQSGWLVESTQAKLELYNPLVMSKMFLLHDAKILDSFNSDYLFWIDAGLTNTVHSGYFTHDNVIDKISESVSKFSFVCFPYDAINEIHGFKYPEINKWAENDVKRVARGGFFGGPKQSIGEVNTIYYGLLISTLENGLMGTEESIFSIMLYKYPHVFEYFDIDYNGLLSTFFENAKNNSLVPKNEVKLKPDQTSSSAKNTSLYVIGFNSPNQLSTLIKSMVEYDENFIKKPKKYLLNNSTDRTTDDGYRELCDAYDFEIINPGENLGICGGRQFIAEHFDKSEHDFMFFFEDDMFFYSKKGEVCRNGFNRYVENLYDKSLKIIQSENFDFIKLNFSEFFGDNSIQWSWYNVPQSVRDEFWPNNPKLPQAGLDPNAPKAKYDSVSSIDGVPYTTGDVYYCNWPQIVSKQGNKKMFLDTTWAHPYEQTWMSHMFQETKKGNLRGGLLLLTPTEHNRFEHYDGKIRKES